MKYLKPNTNKLTYFCLVIMIMSLQKVPTRGKHTPKTMDPLTFKGNRYLHTCSMSYRESNIQLTRLETIIPLSRNLRDLYVYSSDDSLLKYKVECLPVGVTLSHIAYTSNSTGNKYALLFMAMSTLKYITAYIEDNFYVPEYAPPRAPFSYLPVTYDTMYNRRMSSFVIGDSIKRGRHKHKACIRVSDIYVQYLTSVLFYIYSMVTLNEMRRYAELNRTGTETNTSRKHEYAANSYTGIGPPNNDTRGDPIDKCLYVRDNAWCIVILFLVTYWLKRDACIYIRFYDKHIVNVHDKSKGFVSPFYMCKYIYIAELGLMPAVLSYRSMYGSIYCYELIYCQVKLIYIYPYKERPTPSLPLTKAHPLVLKTRLTIVNMVEMLDARTHMKST